MNLAGLRIFSINLKMPVSAEKNFHKKLSIFKNWLEKKERYKKQNISIQPHESSEASGFSNETFSCKVFGKNIDESDSLCIMQWIVLYISKHLL